MSGDMRVAPASVRLSRILNPEKSAEPGSSGIASVLTASTDAMGGGDVLISERKSSRDVGVPFQDSFQAGRSVADPAGDRMTVGQAMKEGAEAYSLNNPFYYKADSFFCRRRAVVCACVIVICFCFVAAAFHALLF